MFHRITVLPHQLHTTVPAGSNLLEVLRHAGIFIDAPCGGNGTCGKCLVVINGEEHLACQTTIDHDMTVWVKIIDQAPTNFTALPESPPKQAVLALTSVPQPLSVIFWMPPPENLWLLTVCAIPSVPTVRM